MDEWVQRAIDKWPDVPALFGWLGLNRRGHWLIQDERVTHPRIIDTMSRNYDCDEHGRWYFQNGPQRGYVALEYTPLIARVQADDTLVTHTGRVIDRVRGVYLDEDSAAILDSPDGAALVQGADLAWVLERLRSEDGQTEVDDDDLTTALGAPTGTQTALTLLFDDARLPVHRCDARDIPATLGFVREPVPREGENSN